MPNDIPPTRSAIFTAGLPPWVRAWTVVWTAIAMILGISGATAVVASAQPAATLGGPVQAQAPARAAVLPDEQLAKGCAFSAPGTGPFSQNICWIDMSTLDAATAASAAGQSMEIQLTDGYKINFKAFLTDSVAGKHTRGSKRRHFPRCTMQRWELPRTRVCRRRSSRRSTKPQPPLVSPVEQSR
ncbi:hypothetical protein ACQGFI_29265 [Rhodococcus sp. 2.95]